MATEIKTWQIVNGNLTLVNSSLAESKRREKEDLERWIKSNPEILGEDIAVIGEQVQTKSGPLDFLGIDNNGNLVIVELKRDTVAREALTQAIDYASDLATWEIEKVSEVCQAFTGQSLEDFFGNKFPDQSAEELTVNQAQRLLLVGFSIEESLNRMIDWLSSRFSVGVNAIILNYIKTASGDELLSRTVIIPEEVEREKTNKKKFVIERSNEPGTYRRIHPKGETDSVFIARSLFRPADPRLLPADPPEEQSGNEGRNEEGIYQDGRSRRRSGRLFSRVYLEPTRFQMERLSEASDFI